MGLGRVWVSGCLDLLASEALQPQALHSLTLCLNVTVISNNNNNNSNKSNGDSKKGDSNSHSPVQMPPAGLPLSSRHQTVKEVGLLGR